MKELFKNIIRSKKFKNTIIISTFIFTVEVLFKILAGIFTFDYTLLRILLSSIIIGYFLSLILDLINKEWINRLIIIILCFVINIYAILQLGFKNFLGNYMSFNTSSQLGAVKDYIKDYFMSFNNKFYFILIPFLLLVLYYIFIDRKIHINKTKINIKIGITHIFSLILLCFIYYLTLKVGFMQNKYQAVKNDDLFKNPSVQSIAVNQFGASVFGVLDVKNYLLKVEYDTEIDYEISDDVTSDDNNKSDRVIDDTNWLEIIDNETNKNYNKISNYLISKDISNTNEYTGLFEGKNLILIMMESVNNIAINEKYFPTLYKLYNEGWAFKNNYSPRSSCSTGNNEFSALTSIYSINTMCSSNVYKNNTYFESLFNVFKRKGYSALSFHDYTDQYYDRHTSHPNLGSTYYGVKEIGISYSNEYKEWPSDVEFIESIYDIFSNEEKFAVMLTTVTTHQPYYTSSTYGDMYLDEFKDLKLHTYTKRYMSKMKVLDQALALLLDKLEESGKLDDTVIVLFGDHYPYGLANSILQPMFDYDISINNEVDRTPFIIYNSKLEPKVFDEYTTYINILPTLANLFNLDYDPRLYFGEDLFDENYSNIAVFADGSWQSPYAFYNSNSSKLNYISDEYQYTDEEIIQINKMINTKISLSNLAIKTNYFEYLGKKFEEYENDNNQELDVDNLQAYLNIKPNYFGYIMNSYLKDVKF